MIFQTTFNIEFTVLDWELPWFRNVASNCPSPFSCLSNALLYFISVLDLIMHIFFNLLEHFAQYTLQLSTTITTWSRSINHIAVPYFAEHLKFFSFGDYILTATVHIPLPYYYFFYFVNIITVTLLFDFSFSIFGWGTGCFYDNHPSLQFLFSCGLQLRKRQISVFWSLATILQLSLWANCLILIMLVRL